MFLLRHNQSQMEKLKNQTNSSGVLIFPSAVGYAAARTLVSKGWSIGLSGGIPPEPTE